jgi:hypothetical protein
MKIFIILISILWSASVIACGSVSKNIKKYWSLGTVQAKEEFLARKNCYLPINYRPLLADPLIVKVVINAIDTGVNKKYN